jgi:hypothetical protein
MSIDDMLQALLYRVSNGIDRCFESAAKMHQVAHQDASRGKIVKSPSNAHVHTCQLEVLIFARFF